MPRQRRTPGSEVDPTSTSGGDAVVEASAIVDTALDGAPGPATSAVDEVVATADLDGGSAVDGADSEQPALEDGEPEGGEAEEGGEPRIAAPTEELPSLIEALLFVSDGPVELKTLARTLGVTMTVLAGAIEELRVQLDGRGLLLQTGPDGAQLITAPHTSAYIEAFLGLEQQRKLSNAALETLAIIAYRQPVTRATIESIRGVSSDGAMQTLRARGLIEDAGRSSSPGRPTLFATTQRFLEHFGLHSPQELPDLGDVALPLPDTSIPMPGLDAPRDSVPEAESGAPPDELGSIDAVADELSELSALAAAARALAQPDAARGSATALLTAGPAPLSLPSPRAVSDSEGDAGAAGPTDAHFPAQPTTEAGADAEVTEPGATSEALG